MAYEKQGFHSGEKLKASQLSAMEDGIIEAEKLAIEAALKGVQADYNESDSTAASYIKNRPFYEINAFEPITWDGVIGDRENVDVSHLIKSEAGTVFMVKLSDNDKLTTEDYIGSTITLIISGEERIGEVTENDVIPAEQANAWGMYGQIQSIVTVFDISLANSSLGVNLQSSGTYGFYSEVLSQRAKSISKTAIKKIDKKFLPDFSSGANMEKGTGVGATQQLQNQENGVTEGYFNFVDKNPSAIAADPSLNAELKYGAVGDYSASFGGKSTAIGKRALSEGTTTVAKGAYSHAEGNNSVTLGANSHAEGKQTTTYGENAHAEGFDTFAEGYISHSEGYKTHAQGACSHAEGNGTEALQDQSHAEGSQTHAKGYASHSEGEGTFAENHACHAEGKDTHANGYCSHSEGISTYANGMYSHSQGGWTYANGDYSSAGGNDSIADYRCDFVHGEGLRTTYEHQTVFGKYNDISDWGSNRPLFMIGNGTDADHRTNAFEVRNNGLVVVGNKVQQMPDNVADGFDFTGKNANATALDTTLTGIIPYGATGDFASAFGGKCAAQGKRSHAEGTTTIAKGKYSHAEGDNSVSLGDDSHAEGNTTVSKGNGSHSEGRLTVAKGDFSHAEGLETKAEGYGSHAEGINSQAIEEGAHTEGYATEAAGKFSHAEGTYSKTGAEGAHAEGRSTASGEFSHSEGWGTTASGNSSHAEGNTTLASGAYSHAGGCNTIASGNYSYAEGNTTQATGGHSHSAGYNTIASGDCAYADGNTTLASGNHSHASGYQTKATAAEQYVVGRWNKENNDALFIVGCGSGENNRKNLFEVLWTGDAYLNGEKVITKVNRYKHEITNLTSSGVEGTVINNMVVYSNKSTPYTSFSEIEVDLIRGRAHAVGTTAGGAVKHFLQEIAPGTYSFGNLKYTYISGGTATPVDVITKE